MAAAASGSTRSGSRQKCLKHPERQPADVRWLALDNQPRLFGFDLIPFKHHEPLGHTRVQEVADEVPVTVQKRW